MINGNGNVSKKVTNIPSSKQSPQIKVCNNSIPVNPINLKLVHSNNQYYNKFVSKKLPITSFKNKKNLSVIPANVINNSNSNIKSKVKSNNAQFQKNKSIGCSIDNKSIDSIDKEDYLESYQSKGNSYMLYVLFMYDYLLIIILFI